MHAGIRQKVDLLGKCSIYQTFQNGDVWQFRVYLKGEKRYFRKSLKTTRREEAEAKAQTN